MKVKTTFYDFTDTKVVATLGTDLTKADKERCFWDQKLPNFGIRVKEGKRSWIVAYSFNNQSRRKTIGPVALVPQAKARKAAADTMADVHVARSKGEADPVARIRAAKEQARKDAAGTFGAILPRYLTLRETDMRSSGHYVTKFNLETKAAPLHDLPIGEIDIVAAGEFLKEFEATPATYNRVRSALRKMWVWLMSKGLATSNPWALSQKHQGEKARKRWLKLDELVDVWHAAAEAGEFGKLVRLLMLSACRRNEIALMPWDELDAGDAADIHEDRVKTGRTFGNHLLPLTKHMREIFNELRKTRTGEFVFTGSTGNPLFRGGALDRGKTELDELIAVRRHKLGKKPMEPWTLHDLRRSFSTIMHKHIDESDEAQALHITHGTIEACMGHVPAGEGGISARYNEHRRKKTLLVCLSYWNDLLMTEIDAAPEAKLPTNVVRLKQKAA